MMKNTPIVQRKICLNKEIGVMGRNLKFLTMRKPAQPSVLHLGFFEAEIPVWSGTACFTGDRSSSARD